MSFGSLRERVEFFTNEVDLYPVVTSSFCGNRSSLEVIEALGVGGAKIFQLREKDLSGAELYKAACQARKIADRYGMLFILNDHVDIALASGADGVHLGQDDFPALQAKKIAPDLIVGVSTHNIPEARQACLDKCDYLNIGPIYATQTKSVACGALGIGAIAEISQIINCPFTVMGGIKAHHIPDLRKAGAKRIAMVTEITLADDIVEKVRELRQLF